MSRVQLALSVHDLATAVEFYSQLFNTDPHKVRPGYANFAIDNPPLKLVLIENVGATSALNHLGVEVESTEELVSTRGRLQEAGLVTADEDGVECCFALQDKVWVGSPDGELWEIYTVLDDLDDARTVEAAGETGAVCCGGSVRIELSSSGCC